MEVTASSQNGHSEMGTSSKVITTITDCTLCPATVVLDGMDETQEDIENRRKYIENICHHLSMSHMLPFLSVELRSKSSFPLCQLCLVTLKDFCLWQTAMQSLLQMVPRLEDFIRTRALHGFVADPESTFTSKPQPSIEKLVTGSRFTEALKLPKAPKLIVFRNAVAATGGVPDYVKKIMMNYQTMHASLFRVDPSLW